METFQELAASRRAWIDNLLKPWCLQASYSELKKAAAEWGDIAGHVDPEHTLWVWAWGRFPDLVHDKLLGMNETHKLEVVLKKDNTTLTGFPDGRKSCKGQLVMFCHVEDEPQLMVERGPFTIDDILSITRTDD